MMQIKNVITTTEAARLWRLDPSTVKKACQQGRFAREEHRKSGRDWLVTRGGMERLYGPQPEERPCKPTE